jgi:hypothetical protein
MTLRSSLGTTGAGAGAWAIAVPHEKQNFAAGGFSVPHSVQNGMGREYAREGDRF